MKITPNLEPRTPNAERPVRPVCPAHSMLGVECSMFDVSRSVPDRFPCAARRFFKSAIGNRQSAIAFTLVELLVVISIMGILAALTVPALKNMGKSNIQVSATRQLLDDIGHARQLAISRHATVYMVFVPVNFWLPPYTSSSTWPNSLTPAELAAAVNLCDKQLTGYGFMSNGKVGDQPGQHTWRYLEDWKSFPDGTFIAVNKFNTAFNYPKDYPISDPLTGVTYPIYSFNYTNSIPFPVETNFNSNVWLPYIAFNYLGQLTFDGINLASRHEYIPLAQGSVSYGIDANKHPTLTSVGAGSITEIPPGNSTNISYNVIDIDPLTGRATQQQYKMP